MNTVSYEFDNEQTPSRVVVLGNWDKSGKLTSVPPRLEMKRSAFSEILTLF